MRLFIPYFFLFMYLNMIKAFTYLKANKSSGIWENAHRKPMSK